MKKLLILLPLSLLSLGLSSVTAQTRTDGSEGSEFKDWKGFGRGGRFALTGEFGAGIITQDDAQTKFAVGADLEFIPDDIFSGRLSYLGLLAKRGIHEISLAPALALDWELIRFGAFLGPGIALIKTNKWRAKFALTPGVFADVWFAQRFGIGLSARYHSYFASEDMVSLTARVGFRF